MQQAIAYSRSAAAGKVEVDEDRIAKAVAENPVVVVGRRGCCMVHVMRRLLQGQGVNPAVCDVGGGDGDGDEAAAIGGISGGWVGEVPEVQLPAVFIGGRLVGGIDRLMAVHISGELVPILKDAGALWL